MYKNLFFTMLVVSIAFSLYYCGTTAIVEDQSIDTQSQDISINTDTGGDTTKDVASDILLSDVDKDDISLSDTISDIDNNDIEVDILSDIDFNDAIEDVAQDVSKDGDGDGGGKDSGLEDNALTDTSIQTYSISGKVTVNGGPPQSGKLVGVFLFDQVPGVGINPVAAVPADPNGDYIFEDIGAGLYYVFAIYDINGDGETNPESGDLFGYYKNNPVEVKSGPLADIDIDIKTIQLMVTSVFMQRQQSRNAYLGDLVAKVVDPKNGAPLDNATVSATIPGSLQVYTLTYNANTEQYEESFNPYSPNPVIAREGDYQFTIQHPAYGASPVVVKIYHKPQKELVTIIQPANNSNIEIGKDLLVEWKNPSPSDQNIMILMLKRVGYQMREVFRDDQQPISNPYTIDGSRIDTSGMYLINVISGRFNFAENGVSLEATSGTVTVNAQ